MKVYISSILPGSKEYLFDYAGIKYSQNNSNSPLTPLFCMEKLNEYQGIVTLLSEKIDKEIIDSLPNLKIIANYAVGYNNIDVLYAKSKNIIVTNTPGVLTEATAELAVTLSLACSRRFFEGELLVRESKFEGWKPQLLLAHGVTGKTIGLIGSGRIAIAAAKMFSGFNTKIIYYSRSRSSEMENLFNAEYKPLDELLSLSDVISLHIPLTNETRNLLNREKLELLKPEAIVVNTARGEVIDEEYLISMLENNRIFAAGFDVYQNEPAINKRLLKLKNVILQPHTGSATFKARADMAELAYKNVINVLKGDLPITPV